MENKNSRHLLEEIRSKLLENLSKLQHAPSVQFQERPPDSDLGEVKLYYLIFYFIGVYLFDIFFPFLASMYKINYS